MTPLLKWVLSSAAVVVASAISYQWLDRPLALLFSTHPHPDALAQAGRFPDPFVPLALVTFVTLGLWNLSGHALSRLQYAALLSSLSLIVADAGKTQLKSVFGRTWPDTWVPNSPSFIHDGVYGFNFFHGGAGYASFPSGHMAITCAVISVLWRYYPAWRTLYIFVALAVAAGLIGANYHFVSDVIAGGFVGITSGWMTTALWRAHEHVDASRR